MAKRVRSSLFKFKGARFFYVLLVLWSGFLILDQLAPLPDPARVRSVIVLAEDNTPLRAFADAEGVWRYPADLDEISPLYIQALLGYEDRWFYYHFGINPLALLRAGWQWVKYGRIISGGSTLTMQVARILDPHARSLPGKLQQMFRALQLEWHYSKNDILTFYLNLAPFGGPIEGVQTASYAYLHKPANTLSHAEAALLAVLPQAPSRLRPDRYPQRAQRYRDKLLTRMDTLNIWEPEVVSDARMERVLKSGFRQPLMAPLFARRMKEQNQQQLARIETALDSDLQWTAEQLVRSRLSILPEHASAAALIMENATGLVRAYVGSADFLSAPRAGHVDMVQALRSPGSTLKPFLYGMAMDKGLIHSASLLSDVPLKLSGYAPQNFMADYRGPVSVAKALQLSLNVPAVDMLQRLKPVVFDAGLQHAGVMLSYPEHERANLSLILGGAGTRLEHLVSGFSALARSGITIKPRFTDDDKIVERRLLSPEASWIINDILADVAPPAGFSAHKMRLSWKTGTSYGFRDAWSVGVNERYTVGVWTGRPDGTPLPGQFGARASGPLLFEIFQALPRPRRALQKPAGVTKKTICWPLGLAFSDSPAEQCHQQHEAWVIQGSVPPTLASLQDRSWSAVSKSFWVNARTGRRVTAACNVQRREQRKVAQWPFELRPWLSAEALQKMRLPAFDASCPPSASGETVRNLAIENLTDRSTIKLPRANYQSTTVHSRAGVELKLQAAGGVGEYTWLLDGLPLGNDKANEGLHHVFSQPGDYELMVVDEAINVDKVSLRIIH